MKLQVIVVSNASQGPALSKKNIYVKVKVRALHTVQQSVILKQAHSIVTCWSATHTGVRKLVTGFQTY